MITMLVIDFDLMIEACSFSWASFNGRISAPSTVDSQYCCDLTSRHLV